MTSIAGKVAQQQARAGGVGTNDTAVKFGDQDYKTLRSRCLQQGKLFEDDLFPAGSWALGYQELGPLSPKTQNLVWKRPKELCPNPCFIIDGATRTDICQGILGDCWLLAAIASLTLDEDILARVVPQGQNFEENYAGIFHFQFWQYGVWVDVVIDDRLPTRNGQLVFVHSHDCMEFWNALLEKAYAKLNGCYEALTGGNTTEGFEDFTGGIAESYKLKKAPPQLFNIIQRALKLKSLLGASIMTTNAYDREAEMALKLVKGHAYSITGAEEVHMQGRSIQLLRLRNPWGKVEWTGPWSDRSGEWDKIDPSEKARLRSVAEDGEFWMAYPDFIQQFTDLDICNLTPDTLTSNKLGSWNYYEFNGQWRVGSTAGGCLNNRATFASNPQFSIKLEEVDDNPFDGKHGCSFLVGLMQKDVRKSRRLGQDLNAIGFCIYEVPSEFQGCTDVHLGLKVFLQHQPVANSSTFTNSREVCDRFQLPPGEYVIIPSTFEPHKHGSFLLRVFTEKQASTRPMAAGLSMNVVQNKISKDDMDPQFKQLFKEISGNDSELSAPELLQVLNHVLSKKTSIPSEGITLETCRSIVNLLDKDGNGKLSLTEFHVLWMKIQQYQKIFRSADADNSGAMNSHEMREALSQAGFQVNNAVLQVIVSRYANSESSVDFDSFLSALIRVEMLFRMFEKLDMNKSGKIQLDMSQWFCVAMN
ncbi:calpain-2 catalytic subunit-like isoform X1 [Paramormyrops kingsleyae]|uniref:calpain-2 catalytic subunit-like isoform X1 n=1 Tax=Paramormyrops kingsleyae TaxID=1676925 RepID=UPI003B97157F